MREIINLVYDRELEKHPDGHVDLVQDVGWYVPTMALGDMLGALAMIDHQRCQRFLAGDRRLKERSGRQRDLGCTDLD